MAKYHAFFFAPGHFALDCFTPVKSKNGCNSEEKLASLLNCQTMLKFGLFASKEIRGFFRISYVESVKNFP